MNSISFKTGLWALADNKDQCRSFPTGQYLSRRFYPICIMKKGHRDLSRRPQELNRFNRSFGLPARFAHVHLEIVQVDIRISIGVVEMLVVELRPFQVVGPGSPLEETASLVLALAVNARIGVR